MLDLEMFKNTSEKICVRCRDLESSLIFLAEMKDQYPDKCRRWSVGERHFSEDVGYLDYYPYLNNVEGNELLWDNEGYAEDNEYKIVEYHDIPGAASQTDLGELDCSGVDVGILF